MSTSSENRFVVARFIARALKRRTTSSLAYFHLSAGAPTADEQLPYDYITLGQIVESFIRWRMGKRGFVRVCFRGKIEDRVQIGFRGNQNPKPACAYRQVADSSLPTDAGLSHIFEGDLLFPNSLPFHPNLPSSARFSSA